MGASRMGQGARSQKCSAVHACCSNLRPQCQARRCCTTNAQLCFITQPLPSPRAIRPLRHHVAPSPSGACGLGARGGRLRPPAPSLGQLRPARARPPRRRRGGAPPGHHQERLPSPAAPAAAGSSGCVACTASVQTGHRSRSGRPSRLSARTNPGPAGAYVMQEGRASGCRCRGCERSAPSPGFPPCPSPTAARRPRGPGAVPGQLQQRRPLRAAGAGA
jgi:hypothetical protein